MTDTALITRSKSCDFHPNEDHEARFDFKTRQGPWGNGCEKAYRLNRAYPDLGLGKGQRLVLIETEPYSYRGYTLALLPSLDAIILKDGNHIDTAASLEGAEARIDEWMEAR